MPAGARAPGAAARRAGVVALGAALVIGACAPALPEDVADGLTVELRQDRSQYADRTAALKVTNGSERTVTLLGASLAVQGFGASSPDGEPRARTLAPGAGRDVRLRLGDVDCAADAPAALVGRAAQTTEVATAAVLVASGADASAPDGVEVEVGVTDPLGRLAAVHTEVCAERLIATGAALRVAGVEPARVTTPDGVEAGGRVTLAVDPVAGGPAVRLVRVAGTTLLSPADGADWSGDDLAVQADGTVVLDVVPARCDPHVVAEDKRGTFLPVTAQVDGAEQPLVYVPMTDDQRAATYAVVHDACGWE